MKVITTDGYVQSEVVADDSLQCSSGANVIQCEDYVVINFSLQHGYLDLAELFVPEGRSALNYATANSVPEVIEKEACERGNLLVLQWLIQHPLGREAGGNDCDPFRLAAGAGQVELLEYLYCQGFRDGKGGAIVNAADRRQLNTVKWLLEHNPYPSGLQIDSLIDIAAGRGNLETLQYFHSLDPLTILEANRPKQDELAWWLRTEEAINKAAKFATVAVLDWLRANGYNEKCSTNAMDHAATFGRLGVLKWLYTNKAGNCTTKAMDGASSNGHFEVVEYLHEHRSEGCTTDAMDLAAGGGHLDVVKWLDGNRLEGCTVQAIQKSVVRGDLRLVEFLTAHYAQFVAQIDPLNCVNNLEILIFSADASSAVLSSENVASMRGHLEGGDSTVELVNSSLLSG